MGKSVLTITAGEPPAFFDPSFGAAKASAHHRLVNAVDGYGVWQESDPVAWISEPLGCK